MTKNADGDNLYSRTAGLVAEFERTRDPDSTEIGQQFAVRKHNFFIFIFSLFFFFFFVAITKSYDRQ